MAERRRGRHPPQADSPDRPPRSADDLRWLREAIENPVAHGLRPVPARSAVAAWEPDAIGAERLARLSGRHVLEAAGFLLS